MQSLQIYYIIKGLQMLRISLIHLEKQKYSMKIYVDADSCPKPIKKILFRLAHRTGIIILFVANRAIIAPRLTNIKTIEVGKGIDKADEYILDACAAPGGKTMQLSAAGADVTAVDISDVRVSKLNENLTRTSLDANIIISDSVSYTHLTLPTKRIV